MNEKLFKHAKPANVPIPLGRTPPHNADMEQALLASCMLASAQDPLECYDQCAAAGITESAFYKPAHRAIWRAIEKAAAIDRVVDEVSVAAHISDVDAAGGHAYLLEVVNRIDTPSHLPAYIRNVKEAQYRRELITACSLTIEESFAADQDIGDFAGRVESRFLGLRNVGDAHVVDSATATAEALRECERLYNREPLRGYVLFPGLAAHGLTLAPGTLTALGAHTSVGKSVLGALAARICGMQQGDQHAFFCSMEMKAHRIQRRNLIAMSGVTEEDMRDGLKNTKPAVLEAAKKLNAARIKYWDRKATIEVLAAQLRRLHRQVGVGLWVIDYVQLVKPSNPKAPREEQVRHISNVIQEVTLELNIATLALAQFNRESQKEKRRPASRDFRESSALEHDADNCLLLWNPNSLTKDRNDMDPVERKQRELIIAKQRDGMLGAIYLTHEEDKFRMFERK